MTLEWLLPEDLTAAAAARRHVRGALEQRGVAEAIVDDVVLIASELAANAVRHGAPPALLRLEYPPGGIRVIVIDHGAGPDPRVMTADTEAGGGRGLAMINALAAHTGWTRDESRLEVWAQVADPPATP